MRSIKSDQIDALLKTYRRMNKEFEYSQRYSPIFDQWAADCSSASTYVTMSFKNGSGIKIRDPEPVDKKELMRILDSN